MQPAAKLCGGIQHPRLEALTKKTNPYANRFAIRQGGWYSEECNTFAGDGGGRRKKPRCKSCLHAHSNIRASLFPLLFPEKQNESDSAAASAVSDAVMGANESEEEEALVSADSVIVLSSNEDVVKFVKHRVNLIGKSIAELASADKITDLSSDAELLKFAKHMKVKGTLKHRIDDVLFIVCCGDDCNACYIKPYRANAQSQCDNCMWTKANSKRSAEQKESRREERVRPDSKVNITLLDPEEQTERARRLKYLRQTLKQKYERMSNL